jgi:HAD superfamily hydrolase (TIGR01509 family)
MHSPPVFRVILCDLDGTLVDSRRDIGIAFQEALRLVCAAPPPPVSVIASHIGKSLTEMVHGLGYRLSPAQLERFLQAYRQHYAAHCARYTRPYPDVEATLQALMTTPLGVVTTKLQEQAEAVLRQLKIEAFFRHVQGGTPGLRLKPAPDTVLAALEALHCPPAQALLVGDTTADILAGKAAGVRTCAVTYGFGGIEAMRRCQPDYWIDTFAELLEIAAARQAG